MLNLPETKEIRWIFCVDFIDKENKSVTMALLFPIFFSNLIRLCSHCDAKAKTGKNIHISQCRLVK